jgi:hypothetical protein
MINVILVKFNIDFKNIFFIIYIIYIMPYVIPALVTKTGNNEDLYVQNDGSGGSAPQQLTSPATVDPDEFTNSTLSLNGSQGNARLQIVSSNVGTGAVNFDGATNYKISNDFVIDHSVLSIGTATGTNVVSYDSTDKLSAFGDSSVAGGPAILAGVGGTRINRLGGAPVQLLLPQNVAPGSIQAPTRVNIPLTPLSEGLWCIVGTGGGNSTQNTADAQFSTMAYVNNLKIIEMGGCALLNVGTSANSDNSVVELFPINGTTNIQLVNTSAQTLVNFGVYAFNISGPIPGTF